VRAFSKRDPVDHCPGTARHRRCASHPMFAGDHRRIISRDRAGQSHWHVAGFSAIAAAMGPLLGGWIVDHIAWQAIFLINPFIALPAIWIALRHVPESYDPEAPPGIDWVGAMLAFGGSGQHRVRTGRSPRPQRARSVACCLLFCRRSAAAHGVRMARRSSSVTHDAPWPVSFAQLQRHQRDDVAALRRAQRRLLPSTV
jgi:hypothetical protein